MPRRTSGVWNWGRSNNLYRTLNAITASAGVPKILIHDLRHSHATLLLAASQPL